MVRQHLLTINNCRQLALAGGMAITCLLHSPVLHAGRQLIQPASGIHQAIEQFVSGSFSKKFRLSTTIGKLDPRLRLEKCTQALEAFYPTGARQLGPTTIGVRCLGSAAWQIFVPVQIKAFGPAVVSKRALPRGTIIQLTDLAVKTKELSRAMHGYYSSVKLLEGMELRHSLASGSIIGPKSLRPRKLVKRGDIITILAESNGLSIRVKGTALMDGFRGQSIRVKNTRSRRVLQGEVIAARTVRIDL